MAEVGDFIRHRLLQLNIGDTCNFPLTQRSSVAWQMQDLHIFHDRFFTSRVDKTRNELVVTRRS